METAIDPLQGLAPRSGRRTQGRSERNTSQDGGASSIGVDTRLSTDRPEVCEQAASAQSTQWGSFSHHGRGWGWQTLYIPACRVQIGVLSKVCLGARSARYGHSQLERMVRETLFSHGVRLDPRTKASREARAGERSLHTLRGRSERPARCIWERGKHGRRPRAPAQCGALALACVPGEPSRSAIDPRRGLAPI